MFGHDSDEDKDVQINDELLKDGDQNQNGGGATEIAPSAPVADGNDNAPAVDDSAADNSADDSAKSDAAATPPSDPVRPSSGGGDDPLLDIKQQALQSLSPLLGHLDQTPEEKFRTTMMLIQAADNQDLVKTAFEAAQGISDEKTRAQALLDIVNEINYFTQKNS
jgi:hypothetical protein